MKRHLLGRIWRWWSSVTQSMKLAVHEHWHIAYFLLKKNAFWKIWHLAYIAFFAFICPSLQPAGIMKEKHIFSLQNSHTVAFMPMNWNQPWCVEERKKCTEIFSTFFTNKWEEKKEKISILNYIKIRNVTCIFYLTGKIEEDICVLRICVSRNILWERRGRFKIFMRAEIVNNFFPKLLSFWVWTS